MRFIGFTSCRTPICRTTMHVGHVMLLCQVGNMPDALTRENTQRFAQDVMPQLKNLWSDYPDHWYPTPLAQVARAHA